MHCRKAKTKTEIVADQLRKRINKGDFFSGQLPAEAVLMAHFQVSRKTIMAAMSLLSNENLIRRVRGTGTFINTTTDSDNAKIDLLHRMVLLSIPIYGHYNETLSAHVIRNLSKNHLFGVIYDANAHFDGGLDVKASISTFMQTPIFGALIHGGSYWKNPIFDIYSNMRNVIIDFYDHAGSIPWAAVLLDYHYAGRMAARHLIEQGCRRIYQIRVETPHLVELSHFRNHSSWQFAQGFKQECHSAGNVTWKLREIKKEQTETNDYFPELLEKNCDGIMFPQDNLAARFCDFAVARGRKVPGDIAIVGCFNTPWSYEGRMQLSSIDMKPEIMGQEAVELLISGKKEVVTIQPELIVRSSSERYRK